MTEDVIEGEFEPTQPAKPYKHEKTKEIRYSRYQKEQPKEEAESPKPDYSIPEYVEYPPGSGEFMPRSVKRQQINREIAAKQASSTLFSQLAELAPFVEDANHAAEKGKKLGNQLAQAVYTKDGRERSDALMGQLRGIQKGGLFKSGQKKEIAAREQLDSLKRQAPNIANGVRWINKHGDAAEDEKRAINAHFSAIAKARGYVQSGSVPTSYIPNGISQVRDAYNKGFKDAWQKTKESGIQAHPDLETLPWYLK